MRQKADISFQDILNNQEVVSVYPEMVPEMGKQKISAPYLQ
jgi:hypothetical protein